MYFETIFSEICNAFEKKSSSFEMFCKKKREINFVNKS